MKNFFFAAALFLSVIAELSLSGLYGNTIIVYGDTGFYNKGYRSYEYKDHPKLSFPVSMTAMGSEISLANPDGYSYGGGISSVQISEGTKRNWVYTERQDKTDIFVPYCFIGYDFSAWAMELGLSYYITTMSGMKREYYRPDGETEARKDGVFFSRTESYVFNNVNIRILKKEFIHIKIRLGREQFNVIDSLFNIAAVFPYNNHTMEIYMSFPTGISGYFPESNQRVGLAYNYNFNPYFLGLSGSFITGNNAGGGGVGSLSFASLSRYSLGFRTGITW